MLMLFHGPHVIFALILVSAICARPMLNDCVHSPLHVPKEEMSSQAQDETWYPFADHAQSIDGQSSAYSLNPFLEFQDEIDSRRDWGAMYHYHNLQDEMIKEETVEQSQNEEQVEHQRMKYSQTYLLRQYKFIKRVKPECDIKSVDEWAMLLQKGDLMALKLLDAYRAHHCKEVREAKYKRSFVTDPNDEVLKQDEVSKQDITESGLGCNDLIEGSRIDKIRSDQIRKALSYLRREFKAYARGISFRKPEVATSRRETQKELAGRPNGVISAEADEMLDLIVQIRKAFYISPGSPQVQEMIDRLNSWMTKQRHRYALIKIPSHNAELRGNSLNV